MGSTSLSLNIKSISHLVYTSTLPVKFQASSANVPKSSFHLLRRDENPVSVSKYNSPFFKNKMKSISETKKNARNTNRMFSMNFDQGFSNIEDDSEEFLEAQVVEAVRMVPCQNHLYMTMSNGKEVEVTHVNPMVGRLLYEDSTPTIFLKLKQTPDLMLPICVGELAIGLLMKGFKREPGVRPNCYELLKNLVNILKYEVRMIRITQRVVDTYYARIYLSRPGDDSSKIVSVDSRPSDAINLAVRCKAPIFVSKSIILSDAVRISFEPDREGGSSVCAEKNQISPNIDLSTLEQDALAEEMFLMKCMNLAAEEERYADAARLRDELTRLRNGVKGKINF